jgi:hypothetical protein
VRGSLKEERGVIAGVSGKKIGTGKALTQLDGEDFGLLV